MTQWLLVDANHRVAVAADPAGTGAEPTPVWVGDSFLAGHGVDLESAVTAEVYGGRAVLVPELEPAWTLERGETSVPLHWVAPRYLGRCRPVEEGVALLRHRQAFRFDPRDGSPLQYDAAGRVASGASGRPVFPRIDPAVIGVVERPRVDGDGDGDQPAILLAENRRRPGYYSLIAGYVDPGETPEEAFAREVLEETGRRITGIQYVASQPWPVSGSLMLGFRASAVDLDPVAETDGELAEVRWATRGEIRAGALPLPLAAPGSIAHRMITAWVEGDHD